MNEQTAGRAPGRTAAARAAMVDVVAQPQLRRAELAFGLAWTSEAAFTVSLGVVAFRNGGAAAVGWVALLRLLPSALLAPFVVGVADRLRRERVLAALSAIRAVALGAGAILLLVDGPMVLVYTLAVVATVAFTVFRPAHSALLPSLCTTTRELTSANAVRGLLDSAGTLLGPALAGVMLAMGEPGTVFAGAGVLSLAAAVVLVRIDYERPTIAEPSSSASLWRDTRDGIGAVVEHRDIRTVFGLGFAQTMVRGALNVFIVVVAFDLLDIGDSGVAVLSAAVGAGGLVGSIGASLLVGSHHLGTWLAVALALWGTPIALLGSDPVQAVAIALLAVVGIGNAIIDIPLFTLPVRLVQDTVLARVFGVFESLVALGVGIGSVATPALISAWGLRTALVVVGVLLPALGLLALRRLRGMDARLAVRETEIEVLRHAPMLSELPVPSIEHLATRLRRVELGAGDIVVEQGGTGGGFYVIIDGDAEVRGDGQLIRTLGPGDSFGEISLLHDVARTATIRATTDLTLFELDPDAFLAAVSGYRSSADAAYDVVARRLARFHPAGIGI